MTQLYPELHASPLHTPLLSPINQMSTQELPTMVTSILDTKRYLENEKANSRHTYKKYKRFYDPYKYINIAEYYLGIAVFVLLLKLKSETDKNNINWVMLGINIFLALYSTIVTVIEPLKNKHWGINILASSKLNTVIFKTVKAQEDLVITKEEYEDILNERVEYERLKREIENKADDLEARTLEAIKVDFKKEGYEKGKQEGIMAMSSYAMEMVNRVKSVA